MAGRFDLEQLNERLAHVLAQANEADRAASLRKGNSTRIAPEKSLIYQEPDLRLKIEHPGGGSATSIVCARKIWPEGIAILHPSFLYASTKCEIRLRNTRLEFEDLSTSVAECRHVEANVHDIKLEFTSKIDLSQFIRDQAALARIAGASLQPSDLKGKLVFLDTLSVEHTLIKYHLRDTSMAITCFENAGQALDHIRTKITNVMLLELDLGEVKGEQTIKSARRSCPDLAIVALTSEPGRVESARDAGADAVLTKPFDGPTLLATCRRAMAERAGSPSERIQSSMIGDRQAEEALRGYLDYLEEAAKAIAEALREDDLDTVRATLLRLRGSGGSFGFDRLSTTATEAVTSLDATLSLEEAAEDIDTVLCTIRAIETTARES